jgi:S1-C subfamily serine protease
VGGEVLMAIDSQSVTGIQELRSMLSRLEPGQEVSLSIPRDEKAIEVPVTLGQQDSVLIPWLRWSSQGFNQL